MDTLEKGLRAIHGRLEEIRDLLAEIRDGMIDMGDRAPPPAPPANETSKRKPGG